MFDAGQQVDHAAVTVVVEVAADDHLVEVAVLGHHRRQSNGLGPPETGMLLVR